jgi:hypothetical protein
MLCSPERQGSVLASVKQEGVTVTSMEVKVVADALPSISRVDQESIQEGNKEGTSSALPRMDLTIAKDT